MKNSPHCEECGFLVCDCERPEWKKYKPPPEPVKQKEPEPEHPLKILKGFDYQANNRHIAWIVDQIEAGNLSVNDVTPVLSKIVAAFENYRTEISRIEGILYRKSLYK